MPKYTPKNVAEQNAHEFGQRVWTLDLNETTVRQLANKYAFTHQYSLRSSDGYERLRVAFLAGAKLTPIV